jgi:hypothetical protein
MFEATAVGCGAKRGCLLVISAINAKAAEDVLAVSLRTLYSRTVCNRRLIIVLI